MISYEKILSALSDCIFNELCEEYVEENVIAHLDHSVFTSGYNTGATKLCLYLRNEDSMVVKIPFFGEFYKGEVNMFKGADEPDGWDYCRAEVIRYDEFKEHDMEGYLLKIELIGYIDGYPIYVQPKAEIFGNLFVEIKEERGWDFICDTRKNIKIVCKTLDIYDFCDGLWLKNFIDTYTQENLKEFYNFLQNHWVSDLHNNNLGYCCGKPVIIDYAGYHEW